MGFFWLMSVNVSVCWKVRNSLRALNIFGASVLFLAFIAFLLHFCSLNEGVAFLSSLRQRPPADLLLTSFKCPREEKDLWNRKTWGLGGPLKSEFIKIQPQRV